MALPIRCSHRVDVDGVNVDFSSQLFSQLSADDPRRSAALQGMHVIMIPDDVPRNISRLLGSLRGGAPGPVGNPSDARELADKLLCTAPRTAGICA
jgi:hypothetical protein